MITKKFFLMAFYALVCSLGYAQSDIPMSPEFPIGGGGEKTQTLVPIVTLDGSILTIDFPEATSSQVVISDQQANLIVYSDSFASSNQVIIDLEDENIGEGNYMLRIYAFGKWWRGEVVIEDD